MFRDETGLSNFTSEFVGELKTILDTGTSTVGDE